MSKEQPSPAAEARSWELLGLGWLWWGSPLLQPLSSSHCLPSLADTREKPVLLPASGSRDGAAACLAAHLGALSPAGKEFSAAPAGGGSWVLAERAAAAHPGPCSSPPKCHMPASAAHYPPETSAAHQPLL